MKKCLNHFPENKVKRKRKKKKQPREFSSKAGTQILEMEDQKCLYIQVETNSSVVKEKGQNQPPRKNLWN